MRYNFVSAGTIGAQGLRGFRPEPHGAPHPTPAPDFFARSRRALFGMLERVERVLAEWPCEQLPDAGELMLAGLGSPVFSLSRYTLDPARIDAKRGSRDEIDEA
jgi:hypothetical protein